MALHRRPRTGRWRSRDAARRFPTSSRGVAATGGSERQSHGNNSWRHRPHGMRCDGAHRPARPAGSLRSGFATSITLWVGLKTVGPSGSSWRRTTNHVPRNRVALFVQRTPPSSKRRANEGRRSRTVLTTLNGSRARGRRAGPTHPPPSPTLVAWGDPAVSPAAVPAPRPGDVLTHPYPRRWPVGQAWPTTADTGAAPGRGWRRHTRCPAPFRQHRSQRSVPPRDRRRHLRCRRALRGGPELLIPGSATTADFDSVDPLSGSIPWSDPSRGGAHRRFPKGSLPRVRAADEDRWSVPPRAMLPVQAASRWRAGFSAGGGASSCRSRRYFSQSSIS